MCGFMVAFCARASSPSDPHPFHPLQAAIARSICEYAQEPTQMTISRASKQIQLRVCNCGITRFASLAEAPASAKRRPTTPAPARLQAAHRLACTTHPLMLNSARYPATSLTCKPANPGTIRKTHTICSARYVFCNRAFHVAGTESPKP